MQVSFTVWCVDATKRIKISVDPKRVDCTVEFCQARTPRWEGDDDSIYPLCAATRIVLKNKQEFLVQGTQEDIVNQLNAGELS